MESKGFFIGVFQDTLFEEKEILIESGDRLFLFTDGIINSKNSTNEIFGDKRIESLIKSNNTDDISKLVKKIESTVTDFSKGGGKEDITIAIIEFGQ